MLNEVFISPILDLSKDKVPNVKFNIAKFLDDVTLVINN